MLWPADPLGRRRAWVERAAEAARGRRGLSGTSPETELLLSPSGPRAAARLDPLPERIPASGFHDWIADAAAAGAPPPMPQRPHRATRVGTRPRLSQRFGLALRRPRLTPRRSG